MSQLPVFRRHTALMLIMLLGLGLRLALWAQPLHQPANDEVEYITVATDLLAGRGWSFYEHYHWLRAPLYPLFLAGSLSLAGGDLHQAALPNIVISVLNIALAYALAYAISGRRVAILAALLTAVLWTNATFASLYMAETLFTTLSISALLATISAARSAQPVRLAVLAGLLFGLAALTRSAILPIIPLAALWLWYVRVLAHPSPPWSPQLDDNEPVATVEKPSPYGRPTWSPKHPSPTSKPHAVVQRLASMVDRPALILLLCAILTLAPWTIRNQFAYGSPILIETGLSYNLWAFNEPTVSLGEIKRTLEQIPNPADRAAYASAKGMARLQADPTILVRKLWPNWVFLARIKPIQDRFLMENYYDVVDLPLFVAALVFDDLLYILIAMAALVGLATQHNQRWIKSLVIGWLLVSIAVMLLTHGEARYRHFLLPLLIPYAAWAMRSYRQAAIHLARQPRFQRLLLGFTGLVFLWSVATAYPLAWARENLIRGWYTLQGDMARATNQPEAAMWAYGQAATAHAVPDPLLRLGDTARAQGDLERALAAYRHAQRLIPIYERTALRLGNLLRSQGQVEQARAVFLGEYLDQQTMLDWSWRANWPDPPASLAVGDGLDYGFLTGFYQAEQLNGAMVRWSGPHAQLRLAAAEPGPAILVLRMAAPHPNNQPVAIRICVAATCQSLSVTGAWRSYAIPITTTGSALIRLESSTFLAADNRKLGLLLDNVSLVR